MTLIFSDKFAINPQSAEGGGGGGSSQPKKGGFIINGSPTNTGGVFSNFTTSNFLVIPFGGAAVINTINNSGITELATNKVTDIYLTIKTPSSFSGDQPIIATSNTNTGFSDIFLDNTGKLVFWNGSSTASDNYQTEANKEYSLHIKSNYQNSTQYVYVSTKTDVDPVELTESDWERCVYAASYGQWGNNSFYSLGRGNTQTFSGSIDMNKLSFHIASTEIFRGYYK